MRNLIMALLFISLLISPVCAASIAIIDRVTVKERVIALALEDVDNSEELEKLLVLCKEKNIHVSLFSPSYFIDSQQTIVKQAVADGHEFGNCGVKKVCWSELREEDITKEYRAADAVLYKVLKVQTSIVKPVYSQYEDKFLSAIASLNSLSVVIRGTMIDSKKLEEKDTDFIRKGNIITISMQDKEAVSSLSALFTVLKNQGYQIVTVSKLLSKGAGM